MRLRRPVPLSAVRCSKAQVHRIPAGASQGQTQTLHARCVRNIARRLSCRSNVNLTLFMRFRIHTGSRKVLPWTSKGDSLALTNQSLAALRESFSDSINDIASPKPRRTHRTDRLSARGVPRRYVTPTSKQRVKAS